MNEGMRLPPKNNIESEFYVASDQVSEQTIAVRPFGYFLGMLIYYDTVHVMFFNVLLDFI
jgi:hypothetical protein